MIWPPRGPPHAGEIARLQPRHDRQAFSLRQAAPLPDFIERAPAAKAQAAIGMDDAKLDAGRGYFRHAAVYPGTGIISNRRFGNHSQQKSDFRHLLRRAAHIAGLAADLAFRQARDSPGGKRRA